MSLVRTWKRVHEWPRRLRWPLKGVLFLATVVLVLYPKVWLLPRWIERLGNLNSTLDPNDPALEPLEQRVVAAAGREAPLDVVLPVMERTVYAAVPYAFDWETWGVVDYLPTVSEVLAQGREDCDGQAVVAASLLRRLGFDAWLVTDLKHVWVEARDPAAPDAAVREAMSPGQGDTSLAGGATGTRVSLVGALSNLARGLSFGVVVFPMGRELIIVVALALLTMQPRSSALRRFAGCGLLVGALGLLRATGIDAEAHPTTAAVALLGLAVAATGWLLLAIKAGGTRSHPGSPGSPVEGDAPRAD